jgi:peptide/nickel transport system permease protein
VSVAQLEAAEVTLEASQGGLWSEAWRRLRRNPSAIIGFVLVSIFILVAIFAPWLAPDDPRAQDL